MAYQSLYRRYRSQNFDEIKGQPHVTEALRRAVAEGRHGHAYLFSGPRGTGKTSTARVLAKALNCQNLDNGQPCGTCQSCVEIEQGKSFDLHELDAASNNKVDDIRDLIAKVALGSPGRTKVYILDEVHMLTPGAENALLKTLEEPPEHVVFVLATTEPHKVVPTIRSRTQHFEFHLLPGDELADHVRWVIADAGLDVDEAGVEYALRQGGGSARDTLSALDLVAATGGVPEGSDIGHELALAIGAGDPGAAMMGVQRALATGREPRTIGEETLEALRNAFLASMGASGKQLNEAGRMQSEALASTLGAATITRALETLGRALVDMRQAPDPRVPLEVALIRLTRRDGEDTAALLQRIETLESIVASLGSSPPAPAAQHQDGPVPVAGTSGSASSSPGASGRAQAPPSPRGPASSARTLLAAEPPTGTKPTPSPATATAPAAATANQGSNITSGPPVSLDQLTGSFNVLLDNVEQRIRARFRLGHFTAVEGDVAVFSLPNDHVVPRCEEVRVDVERALQAQFNRPLTIRLAVDGAPSAGATPAASAAPAEPSSRPSSDTSSVDNRDDIVDVTELENATDIAATGIDRLTEAFPGATVIDSPTI